MKTFGSDLEYLHAAKRMFLSIKLTQVTVLLSDRVKYHDKFDRAAREFDFEERSCGGRQTLCCDCGETRSSSHPPLSLRTPSSS
jgi:hypothetical protein